MRAVKHFLSFVGKATVLAAISSKIEGIDIYLWQDFLKSVQPIDIECSDRGRPEFNMIRYRGGDKYMVDRG